MTARTVGGVTVGPLIELACSRITTVRFTLFLVLSTTIAVFSLFEKSISANRLAVYQIRLRGVVQTLPSGYFHLYVFDDATIHTSLGSNE